MPKRAACLLCTTLLSLYLISGHPPSVVAHHPSAGPALPPAPPERRGSSLRPGASTVAMLTLPAPSLSSEEEMLSGAPPAPQACLLALRSGSWLWRPSLVGGGSPNPMCLPCGCQQPGEASLMSFLSSAAHVTSFSQLPLAWKEKHHHLPDSLSYKG